MSGFRKVISAVVFLGLLALAGCEDLTPKDAQSVLFQNFKQSEVVGFLAGLGTTFASVPDLLAMLRRRSSAGMNPRMPAIMGTFQVLWVYYGLLIPSRPVILWNVIAVLINAINVGAYFHFQSKTGTGKERET